MSEVDLSAEIAAIAEQSEWPDELDPAIQQLALDERGTRLAVGLVGHVVLVEVATGRRRVVRLGDELWEDLAPFAIAMSADGKRAVIETLGRGLTNADDSASDVWVVEGRAKTAKLAVLMVDDSEEYACRAISRDTRTVAVGTRAGHVELYELDHERLIARAQVFRGKHAAVSAIGLAANGSRLGLASWSGELAVLDVPGLEVVARWRDTPPRAYGRVSFSDDAATVIRTLEPFADKAPCGAVIATLGDARPRRLDPPGKGRFEAIHVSAERVIWLAKTGGLVRQELATGACSAITHADALVAAVSHDGARVATAHDAIVRCQAAT